MSKVPYENGENGQSLSTLNTTINENDEYDKHLSTSNTQVINESQSPSSSNTIIVDENSENDQSLSTNTKAIKAKPSRKEKLKILLRVLLMFFFELALPLILFYVLKKHIGEIWALIVSGAPPFLVVVYGFIRNRRVDVLGAMVVITSIVGIILTLLKNDPRFFLLRESVMTGAVGLVFLFTLIQIKIGSFQMRPIIFYFSRDMVTGGTFGSLPQKSQLPEDNSESITERWDRYWNDYAVFRRGFFVLTSVWGTGLLVEVPARAIIVFKAPTVERAVFFTTVVTYSWLSVLILFNIIYSKIFKKRLLKVIPKEEASELYV